MQRWRTCGRPTSRRSARSRRPSPTGTTSTSTSRATRFARAATASAASRASGCSRSCSGGRPSSASSCTSRREIGDVERLRESCDLLVGADGANSRVRADLRGRISNPIIDQRTCRFMWLGTTLPLDAFTFIFERTEHGWFTVHAYRFDDDCSTFIVECREETWLAHGLDTAGTEQTIAFCEQLFAPYLHGHRLMANSAHLRRPRLAELHARLQRTLDRRQRRADRRRGAYRALLGRLGHEARDGGRDRLGRRARRPLDDELSTRAAASTKPARKIEVLKLQNAARNSTEWFENVARYATLPPEQFAYSLLTRSQRIGHENLRLRDTTYVGRVERWFAGRRRSRRCSFPFGCANWSCAIASSSRRWTCTAPSTARPTICTSCTSARARWAAPAWCSPR